MTPPSRSPSAGDDLPALGVRRPWLVVVLNLLIAIAGIAAARAIEVRELPDVDRPVVSVRAEYPGASPETMDAEVTSVVEGAVARVSGVHRIRSASEENNSRIRVEFQPGVNLEDAAAEVREAVSRVSRELPEDVAQLAVYKADEDAEEIVKIAVMSDRYAEATLTRIVEQDIVPQLLALQGVADAPLFGNRQRVLRVIVDPLRLTSYGLTFSDVARALRQAPLDVPAGSFKSADQELIVRADASAVTEEAVASIVIRDGIRIADVGEVVFSPADATSFVRLNGRRVIGLGVVRKAGSNTIEISNGVSRVLERLNARFEDIELRAISDAATFIRGSVREVVLSLTLAVIVVIATIRVFSGSLRLTLIPAVGIPIALLGTLAGIWLVGFSINILTLLALVLATGLIVDDAIVVLENIQRRRHEGLGPYAAAVLGTRQVFFAVVATTAVLVAVFVPLMFLPGTAGGLFREFGFVLALAVAISSFVALSLVPAAMARMDDDAPRGPITSRLDAVGGSISGGYGRALRGALNHPWLTLLVAITIAGAAGGLFTALERELLPPEDRGRMYVYANGPSGVGLDYTERQANRLENILEPLHAHGEVTDVYTTVGRYDLNRARVVAPLAPWSERERSQQEIEADIAPLLNNMPGARAGTYSQNSLKLRGAGGGGIEVALLGTDYATIYAAAREFTGVIESRLANIRQPRLSYQPTQPQLSVRIDRRRASDLGVSLDDIATTLRAMIDGQDVVDLNVADQAIPIMLEGGAGNIDDPSDLVNLHVRAGSGGLVPLSSLVELEEAGVAAELDRTAQRRSIEVDAEIAPGYALQAAVDDLERIAEEVLPPSVSMVTQGEAATLAEAARGTALTYAFALLVVLLVLVAQFESLTSALVVMLIVPFGLAAAVFALFSTGTTLNIYSQVGLVLLIGLIAKNGILLVEFADQLRDRGFAIREAIATSARIRLRPVTMTMVSTIFGALPLIVSSGPGAEARHAIGWVVFGGLGLTALFTLFLLPVLYIGLTRFSKPRVAAATALASELDAATEAGTSPQHA